MCDHPENGTTMMTGWRVPAIRETLDTANEWLIGQVGEEFRGELETLKTVCPDVVRLRLSIAALRDQVADAMPSAAPAARESFHVVVNAFNAWLERTKHLSGLVVGDPSKATTNDEFAGYRRRLEAVQGDRQRINAVLREFIAELEARADAAEPTERARLLKGVQQLRLEIHE